MSTNSQLAPPMIPEDLMPLLSGESGGDGSMLQRPMTGSASGPSPADVAPAEAKPAAEEGFGLMHRPSPEEPSPQGPPSSGKEQFHNTMSDFGHRAEINRAAVIGLNPSDPDYLKKLEALQAQHGAITQEKARYQMLHPWGGPESAHPGVLGKIGHVAGKIGQVAGSAIAPNLMQDIPGSQANIRAQGAGGVAEENTAVGNEEKAAQAAHTEAEIPAVKATTEHTQQETEDLKNKPEPKLSVQDQYSAAVADAQKRGVDPNTDTKVKQLADTITSIQRQNAGAQEKLDQQYQDALASGDHEKAERILKVKADLAKAGQAPQRPPQTMVVLPGGQTEVARPGMTLPEGTQNIGGFATMNRPTSQQRNVQAQAGIAAQGIPEVVSEIDKLKDQLGPVSGRWNEFMQGRVGMENPEMAGLRADLLMVSSAVALAHARGRLPENLRAEFDSAINAPKQDPENLKAVLNHILPWMQRMEKMTDQPNQPSVGGGGNKAGGGKKWNALKGVYE
jgi:hypothetical protein